MEKCAKALSTCISIIQALKQGYEALEFILIFHFIEYIIKVEIKLKRSIPYERDYFSRQNA